MVCITMLIWITGIVIFTEHWRRVRDLLSLDLTYMPRDTIYTDFIEMDTAAPPTGPQFFQSTNTINSKIFQKFQNIQIGDLFWCFEQHFYSQNTLNNLGCRFGFDVSYPVFLTTDSKNLVVCLFLVFERKRRQRKPLVLFLSQSMNC